MHFGRSHSQLSSKNVSPEPITRPRYGLDLKQPRSNFFPDLAHLGDRPIEARVTDHDTAPHLIE